MKKISKSIYKSRKQTSYCIVLMFWPKQMYDRNTSPNPRRKSKEQIVLSTCVGYGQKPPKHQQTTKSRLIPVGATQLKGASHLWQNEFLSAPISLDALWSSRVSTQQCPTPLRLHEHCSAAESIRYSLSYGSYHMNTGPAGNRRSFVCTVHSVIIAGFHLACYFASQEHNSWTGSKQASTADTSHQVNAWAGRRWGCCFYFKAPNERNNQ